MICWGMVIILRGVTARWKKRRIRIQILQTIAPLLLPPQKQVSLIQEGIDLAVEQLLKEISVKVMIEADMTGIKGSITLLRRKKNWFHIILWWNLLTNFTSLLSLCHYLWRLRPVMMATNPAWWSRPVYRRPTWGALHRPLPPGCADSSVAGSVTDWARRAFIAYCPSNWARTPPGWSTNTARYLATKSERHYSDYTAVHAPCLAHTGSGGLAAMCRACYCPGRHRRKAHVTFFFRGGWGWLYSDNSPSCHSSGSHTGTGGDLASPHFRGGNSGWRGRLFISTGPPCRSSGDHEGRCGRQATSHCWEQTSQAYNHQIAHQRAAPKCEKCCDGWCSHPAQSRKSGRVAAKKNLEAGISFSSFPDSKIISILGRVGINLGTSDIAVIKNIEVDMLILCANQKKKNISKSNYPILDSDDEREDRLEAILSHTSGNLNENMLDQEDDQILDLSPLHRKKIYNNAKKTNKGRLPKKPKTPSKIILRWKGFSGIVEVLHTWLNTGFWRI